MNRLPDDTFDFIKYLESKGFITSHRNGLKTVLRKNIQYDETIDAIISRNESPILCSESMPSVHILYENPYDVTTVYLGMVPMNFDHAALIYESVFPENVRKSHNYKLILRRL